MSVLEVENLAVTLAGRPVIRDASLTVDAGEFVGLLGPNGAGKTTLMRSVLGLIPIDSGRVEVCGTSGRAVRELIGYVPQRHEVAWDFPIDVRTAVMGGRTGLIGFFRRPREADHAAVDEALERVRLTELSHRPIEELSGGQRQRVLVARALATRPTALLLDEPFTGLDIPSSEQLLDLFDELAGQGTAIVMSTHNLAEAVHACHRLVLFNRTVIAEGPRARLTVAQPWIDTFGVRPDSPLLSSVGVQA
ncbi:anchored repeat-type ABC transporter ATP-binding subunit [Corynebacterium timonense]|uniref:Anchored repeat-type ABC transporter, ATP-binding subunit n=1 Tax=Corynebacterium timonense TaxID=441500 RepID=A0A1H1PWG4_9CORY|nr:anchored repeat-type ABC transporter ATP-binding subunit [Corynebacterium timonense]SDS15532.1 anchored repeat-type ABC transporter, ATP-binding subunit [Corynebacterium timonense]